MEEIRYDISEGNKAIYFYKAAITVLNEKGDHWGGFAEGYDKLRSIESFEGTLFDATGKKVKSLKKGDIKDVSGSDESSLADDNRIKWHSFYHKSYPYTVEYKVEIHYKGTMFLRDWMPQEKTIMAVQQSRISVTIPESNPLRYKMFNYKGEPVINEEKGDKIYTWEIKDLTAVEQEYAAPAWHELTTTVFLATEKFVLEDYEGSNASWKDFGRFIFDLKKEKDVLPEDVKQKVHQLTDGNKDEKEKITRLYEYLQEYKVYQCVSWHWWLAAL